VDPAHIAVALERDTNRIFDYVRDNIAYEAYGGRLRGARGTLLAMAGNAIDRATLLASLLTAAGHRVRYARGTLSTKDATDLVMSMWVTRPLPAATPATQQALEAGLDAFRNLLETAIRRDFKTIREKLAQAKIAMPGTVPSLEALVQETRIHHWVQVRKGGTWIDLDPSFRDARPGTTYAKANHTFDTLPADLDHRLTIRIQLEEYNGQARATKPILTYSATTVDISGSDLVLVHLPAGWTRPGEPSTAQPQTDPGEMVKPVLFAGRTFVAGEPFRHSIERSLGSRVGVLLGRGTRPGNLVTAEVVEFTFTSPDGRSSRVEREIFDLIGPAGRSSGQPLTEDNLRRVAAAPRPDLAGPIYSLFFTTGRIDASHFPEDAAPPVPGAVATGDVASLLRAISVAVVAATDAVVSGVRRGGNRAIRFYPDTPRLHILELSGDAEHVRVSLDIRRDGVRAVGLGVSPEEVFLARVLRGVISGTLERMIVEHLFTAVPGIRPFVSTSGIFERAEAERVRALLLPSELAALDRDIAADAVARLRGDASQGYLIVAPQKAVMVGDAPRHAWWRIDQRSGETVAVTDDGLHQTGGEQSTVKVYVSRGPSGWWAVTVTQHGYGFTRVIPGATRLEIFRNLAWIVWGLLRRGARFGGFGEPPYIPLP
jgi:hypothetical protein